MALAVASWAAAASAQAGAGDAGSDETGDASAPRDVRDASVPTGGNEGGPEESPSEESPPDDAPDEAAPGESASEEGCSCTAGSNGQSRIHVCVGSYDADVCSDRLCNVGQVSAPCRPVSAVYCCIAPSRGLYAHMYTSCTDANCEGAFFAQCRDWGGLITDGSCPSEAASGSVLDELVEARRPLDPEPLEKTSREGVASGEGRWSGAGSGCHVVRRGSSSAGVGAAMVFVLLVGVGRRSAAVSWARR